MGIMTFPYVAIVGLVDEPDLNFNVHKMKYIHRVYLYYFLFKMAANTASCNRSFVSLSYHIEKTYPIQHCGYKVQQRQMAEDLLQCCIGSKITGSYFPPV